MLKDFKSSKDEITNYISANIKPNGKTTWKPEIFNTNHTKALCDIDFA